MNRLAYTRFGIALLVLAGAQSLRAQQINPRVPPPPPPAEAPSASSSAPMPPPAATPDATPATAPPTTASAEPTKPIDPTVPPPPPSLYEEPDPPAAPSGPVFDPLHAQRSLDVGTFYMKKGSYDAAIDRFIEASNYQPTLAMPWKLLGEAYEKKHENAKAVESYNKYLRILPHAADAEKIKKQIADLQEKSAEDSKK